MTDEIDELVKQMTDLTEIERTHMVEDSKLSYVEKSIQKRGFANLCLRMEF